MKIDQLATMVQRGFEQTATKEELGAVKTEIAKLATKTEMREGFERIELHVSSLGSDWKERFDALEMRVRKLEQKRG